MTHSGTYDLERLRARIDQGEQEQAISTILGMLRGGTNVPDVHRLLAYGYLKGGKTIKAIRELRTARTLGTTAQTEIAFGRMLRTHEYFESALTCFQAAVELEPDNFDAQCLVAMTYQSLGQLELAIEYGQTCLETADRAACQQPLNPLPFPNPVKFDTRRHERNIIAFSLFGDDPYYLECATASASMALAIYPEWKCRFYCAPDVPQSCLKTLLRLNAQVGRVSHASQNWSGLFWRFFAFDDPDVDFVMVRDVDSPFTIRERLAVEDWLSSGFPFHVIRDSPAHLEPIMAGLWAGRTGLLPPLQPMISKFLPMVKTKYGDQHFLRLNIWPLIRNITLAHDRYHTLRESRRPPEHPTQDTAPIGFGLPRENSTSEPVARVIPNANCPPVEPQ